MSQCRGRRVLPKGGGEHGTAEGGRGVKFLPHTHHSRDLSAMEGGRPHTQRKAQTCRVLPLTGSTCRFGGSMKTYLATIMGHA